MGTVYCFARGMFMRESAIRESHGKGETTTKDQHEIEVLDRSKHGFQNKTLECAKPFVVSFNSTLTRVGKGKQSEYRADTLYIILYSYYPAYTV